MIVKIGGSNNTFKKQWDILKDAADSLPLRIGLGSKFYTIRMNDTVENKRLVEKANATIVNRIKTI